MIMAWAEHGIYIAHYRGLCMASARGLEGRPGAMMAVEATPDNALNLLQESESCGRARMVAINIASGVTGTVFGDDGEFAWPLEEGG